MRKPEEVNISTVQEAAKMLVTTDAGHFLLFAGIGNNSQGSKRDVCVLFEVDPEVNEWRPISMVDSRPASLKDEFDGTESSFTFTAMDFDPVTPKEQYACWIDAVKKKVDDTSELLIQYQTALGDWKTLVENPPAAGFAPIPLDATSPIDLRLLEQ